MNKWTTEDVRNMICNPIYVGMGPFPAMIADDVWIQTAKKAIRADGEDIFFKTMLAQLRASMETLSVRETDE